MAWFRILSVAIGYGSVLFLIQCHWISCLGYLGFRIDLLLPLALHVALCLPPTSALCWCLGWGFIMDTFSGRLWGLHLGTYLVMVLLVTVASAHFELRNPFYRLLCVAICAIMQALALGGYVVIASAAPPYDPTVWVPLLARTAGILCVAPLIGWPFEQYTDQFRSV